MDELIAELEKAAEGSRELDYQIAYGPPGPHLSDREGAPHYTTNLQDALGLVPEGCALKILLLPKGHFQWRAWVFPSASVPDTYRQGDPCLGHTAALALCIASLKARRATLSPAR